MAPVSVWRGRLARDCRFAPRVCDLVQHSTAHVFGRHSRHADNFIAAALAGRNGNGRSRHLQKFCEKLDAGFVGSAFDRRGGEREFERIADFACDRILFGARMNSDRKRDTVFSLVNGDQDVSAAIPRLRCT